MARWRVQEVKPVKEVMSWDTEVEKEKISLQNLSIILDLRKEIMELQLSSHEFWKFKEKEMKRRNIEFRVDGGGVM
jgi:hypothetical protein